MTRRILAAVATLATAVAAWFAFRGLGHPDPVPPYPAREPWGDL